MSLFRGKVLGLLTAVAPFHAKPVALPPAEGRSQFVT
jgi:hypothetical protein